MMSRINQCSGLVGLACVLLLSLAISLPLSEAAPGDSTINSFVVPLPNPLPASIAVTYPASRFSPTTGNPSALLLSTSDNVTALDLKTGAQLWQSSPVNLTSALPSKAAGHMRVDTYGGLWILPYDGDSLLHYTPCKGTSCDQLYLLSDRIGLSYGNRLGSSDNYYAQPPLDLIESIMLRTIFHPNLGSSYLAMWARGRNMPTPTLYVFDTTQRKLAFTPFTFSLQETTSCTGAHDSINLVIPNQGRSFIDVDVTTNSSYPFLYAICGATVVAFGFNRTEPLFTYDFSPTHNASTITAAVQGVSSLNSDLLMLITQTSPALERLPFAGPTPAHPVTVVEALGDLKRGNDFYSRVIQAATLIPNSACTSPDTTGCADNMMIRVYEATPIPGESDDGTYPFSYMAAYTYSDAGVEGPSMLWDTYSTNNATFSIFPSPGAHSQPFAFNDGSDFDVIFWLLRSQQLNETFQPIPNVYGPPMLHAMRRVDGVRMRSISLAAVAVNLPEVTNTTDAVLGCDILDVVPKDRTVFVNCASLYGSVLAISYTDSHWNIVDKLPPVPSPSSTGSSSSTAAAFSSTGPSSGSAVPSSSASPSSTAPSSSSTSSISSSASPSSTAGSVVPPAPAAGSSSTGVDASSTGDSSSSTGAGGSAVEGSSSGPSTDTQDNVVPIKSDSHLSGGVTALIVIFCLLVGVVAIILFYRYYRSRQVESARHHMGTMEMEGGGAFGGHSMIELEEERHGGLDDQDVAVDMHGSVSEEDDESPIPRGNKRNEFAEVALDGGHDHQLQEPSGLHGADEEEEDENGETFDAAAVAAAKAAKKKKKAAKKAKKAAKKQQETAESEEDDDALDM